MSRLVLHSIVLVGAVAGAAWMLVPPPPGAAPEKPAAAALVVESGARPAESRGFAGDDTVIDRDSSGQFHIQARVNGEDTQFLVDSGADLVALTPAEAERLGLAIAPEDFRPIVRTASGIGKGAPVRLDSVEFGGEDFGDVEAMVVEGLGVNLLGQSMLRRLGSVELHGDRMVIKHR